MRIEVFSRRSFFTGVSWYFRFIAANGEIVASSEGYTNKYDCADTAVLVATKFIDAEVMYV